MKILNLGDIVFGAIEDDKQYINIQALTHDTRLKALISSDSFTIIDGYHFVDFQLFKENMTDDEIDTFDKVFNKKPLF